jgi:peptidyl-prolyl cis-trans isomerase C
MRISRLLFVLGTAGMLAACTKPADDAAKGADAAAPEAAATTATTVATVNGKKLSGELYDTFVQAVTGGQMQEPLSDEQKTQLIDQLVNMTLAAQAAEKDGLQKDPKVAARVDLLRTQILAEAASEKYIKAHPVSETELKAEYDAQIASMPKEYKARHILVDKQETAESIIRELQAGGDFSKLAKAESKDSSAQAGGDLGWFSPASMVKPFADAVAALEKGKYTSTPVQSEFGYHVIILDDVRNPEAPSFEDVKPQVEMFVQRKKLQEYLDGLRKTAQIQK